MDAEKDPFAWWREKQYSVEDLQRAWAQGAEAERAQLRRAVDDLDPNDDPALNLRLLLRDLRALIDGKPLPRANRSIAAFGDPDAIRRAGLEP